MCAASSSLTSSLLLLLHLLMSAFIKVEVASGSTSRRVDRAHIVGIQNKKVAATEEDGGGGCSEAVE